MKLKFALIELSRQTKNSPPDMGLSRRYPSCLCAPKQSDISAGPLTIVFLICLDLDAAKLFRVVQAWMSQTRDFSLRGGLTPGVVDEDAGQKDQGLFAPM